jgi:hypothetical protein
LCFGLKDAETAREIERGCSAISPLDPTILAAIGYRNLQRNMRCAKRDLRKTAFSQQKQMHQPNKLLAVQLFDLLRVRLEYQLRDFLFP